MVSGSRNSVAAVRSRYTSGTFYGNRDLSTGLSTRSGGAPPCRAAGQEAPVEFGAEIGEYRGVVRVPRRISERPLASGSPQRRVETRPIYEVGEP
jgi:hypothetical protein